MSKARNARDRKRQLGQFFTPQSVAAAIVDSIDISVTDMILEPSYGDGSFIFAIVDSLANQLQGDCLSDWCASHFFGCELDESAFRSFAENWSGAGYGEIPRSFEREDFFRWMPSSVPREAAIDKSLYFASRREQFDLVIGNPPFGGTIDASIQDELDSILGRRDGMKIKKETYSFFIVKSVDLLKPGGRLVFICSDTLLTIPTMSGLRSWLQSDCDISVSDVPGSFEETNQGLVLVSLTKRPADLKDHLVIFGEPISRESIRRTPNSSWGINGELAKFFTGVSLGDKMVASSGMTIGNNKLFLRQIEDGAITEPCSFSYGERPITLEREIERARLGKISEKKRAQIRELEESGATERVVVCEELDAPETIALPHEDYRYYNKATRHIIYSEPEWVIFWRDEGEYVYTFKKSGPWYLGGVGGKKFFNREGITWALIAPRLHMRFLPEGYILDSGAPCAFLREGVEPAELYFIMGWTLTEMCTRILKEVLNHTRNNQSKDFERLPYPSWVSAERKEQAVGQVKSLIEIAMAGVKLDYSDERVRALEDLYAWVELPNESDQVESTPGQMTLFG